MELRLVRADPDQVGGPLPRWSYVAYMQSSLWLAKRAEMLELSDHCCEFCGNDEATLHVHHLTYEHLGYEAWQELIVLCASCHADAHEYPKRMDEIRMFSAGRIHPEDRSREYAA